ncbi:COX15/CtaA family protein [Deinococcus fonticola]|uniref:COX15/CtaA family protein n=1 Tax=Deinococcus fonticola TaxID=2528713 RepID=UPI001F106E33|nr:COX15/CtaA family protein [Deinococcus fonticola]
MSGTLRAAAQPGTAAQTWLSRVAWAALVYNILVILWGAVVRITGAGAGCGDHWPLCDGRVVPHSFTFERVIEFSHRLTSGASGLIAIALVVLAFRATPRGHLARTGALWTLGLILLEGLVGGVQVLLGLTATSTDPARGFVQGIHMANTFALLGAALLTALWASGNPALRLRGQGRAGLLSYLGLALLLLMAMAGAVTALGDLLFLPEGGSVGISTVKKDFAVTASIIENLRVVHPLLSVVGAVYLAYLAAWLRRERPDAQVTRWSRAVWALLAVQLVAGFVNVALRAPAWMQLTHLLLACVMWLATVMLVYRALTTLRLREVSA